MYCSKATHIYFFVCSLCFVIFSSQAMTRKEFLIATEAASEFQFPKEVKLNAFFCALLAGSLKDYTVVEGFKLPGRSCKLKNWYIEQAIETIKQGISDATSEELNYTALLAASRSQPADMNQVLGVLKDCEENQIDWEVLYERILEYKHVFKKDEYGYLPQPFKDMTWVKDIIAEEPYTVELFNDVTITNKMNYLRRLELIRQTKKPGLVFPPFFDMDADMWATVEQKSGGDQSKQAETGISHVEVRGRFTMGRLLKAYYAAEKYLGMPLCSSEIYKAVVGKEPQIVTYDPQTVSNFPLVSGGLGVKKIEEKFKKLDISTSPSSTSSGATESESRSKECSVCLDRSKCIALLCGHQYCEVCPKKIPVKICPTCQAPFNIEQIIKLFDT